MRITVTGATGLLGARLVAALRGRGDEVTILSRRPERTAGAIGWDPEAGPAPRAALEGRDAVVHLAGEPVAQRWSPPVKQRILASREVGTRNLVAGLQQTDRRPRVLVSASGVGYYGAHGDEEVPESTPAGGDFLARVCVAWEREAQRARECGLRVAYLRTGIVLDRRGGALVKMLPPFRLGLGGPVAGGRQYMPWIHVDDVVGMYVAALDDERWSGAFNATAPVPVTNREFSRALGRALRRPAVAPVPGFAVRLLFGEMSLIVTDGQRAVPARALELGYSYRHPDLDSALRHALSS